MGWRRTILVFLCIGGVVFSIPLTAEAARGTPDSPEFGYGARLDLDGSYLEQAVNSAAELRLDWISVDLNWAKRWPDPNSQPDLRNLDEVFAAAAQFNLVVLLSLSAAPDWAMGEHGPDPRLTAWFVVNLERRYGNKLAAVELFPAANTAVGWGGPPDARAYAELLATVQASIKEAGIPVLVVAGGLTPLLPGKSNGDIDDLAFLQGLYDAGAREVMPVASLHLADVSGDSLQPPVAGGPPSLRHYEEIRKVMVANNHSDGVIWITDLSWPSGRIGAEDATINTPQAQSLWLSQAYRQLRAQLYIGTVFIHRLNPPAEGQASPDESSTSLIRANLNRHPFYNILGQLATQNLREASEAPAFDHPQEKNLFKVRP